MINCTEWNNGKIKTIRRLLCNIELEVSKVFEQIFNEHGIEWTKYSGFPGYNQIQKYNRFTPNYLCLSLYTNHYKIQIK